MKKLRFFAMMLCIATIGMMITSCTKDEELIVGQWSLTYGTRTVVQVDSDGQVKRYSGTIEEDTKWQFSKDGIIYQYATEGEETVADENDRYVVRDGYLVLSKKEDMFWLNKYKIEKLTNKKLILSYNYDGEIPDHDAEFTEKIWLEFDRD